MAGVVVLPETIIRKLKSSIPRQWRVCFFAALLVGFVSHFYKITNWIPNWDSLVFRVNSQNMIGLGRWFLPLACAPSSFYDLPFLCGFLAIVFHALGAVCILKVSGAKKDITAALIGGVIASFPAVVSIMMYNYVADGYALAFLLSCLAAVCLTNEKPRYITAVILIALSAGIYQAYITVTVMLLLMYLITRLIFEGENAVPLFKKSIKFLLCGVFGMILYYLILLALLKVFGRELMEYQGVSSAASFTDIDILSSLYVVKNTFFNFFFNFSKGVSVYPLLCCIICAVTLVGYFAAAIKNKSFMPWYKGGLLILYAMALPMGACILAFVNPEVDYHNLMKMGYCVFFIFFVLLYEKEVFVKLKTIKCWSTLFICAALILNQIVIANVSYHTAQISYEKSYAVLIRMADRIESTADSEKCRKILVVGALSDSESYSAVLPPDITGISNGYILRADDEVVGQSVLCSALNDYCGKAYSFVYGDEKREYLQKDEIKNMPSWPEENSVAVLGDVIVIKLSSEVE